MRCHIPDLGVGGALYDAGELCVLTSDKHSVPHFIHKTRRYCQKHIRYIYYTFKHQKKVSRLMLSEAAAKNTLSYLIPQYRLNLQQVWLMTVNDALCSKKKSAVLGPVKPYVTYPELLSFQECWHCQLSSWQSTCTGQNHQLSCCPGSVCRNHQGPRWWCDEDLPPLHVHLYPTCKPISQELRD